MRVWVTGAGGFVGSHVVRRLTDDGKEVVAIDRNPETVDRAVAKTPASSTIKLDLDDIGAVRALLRAAPPEGLIHLAWYANPKDYLTSHANLASLAMTTALVEAALAAGCRKLVLSGSCAEYALQSRLLTENDPVEVRSIYAACKHSAWHVSRVLAAEANAELAWSRIFHIHGQGEDRRRLIPWVADQLRARIPVDLTDGTQTRDHLHVSDVASALVALLAPGASGIYNVCSGEPVRLKHVLETVGDIVGGRSLLNFGALPHRPNETMFLAGDSSRLRALGWRPRFQLRDGLTDALSGSS